MFGFLERAVDSQLTRFLETSQGRAIADQALRAEATERRNRAQQLARERQDTIDGELAAIAEHTPRAAAADEKVERTRADFDASVRERHRLEAEHRAVVWPLQHRRSQIEGELYRLASPLIRELRDSLQTELETTSAQRDSAREKTIDGGTVLVWSNSKSIARRIEAICATRNEMPNWYLDALSDDETRARFDSRRAEWPAVEERPEKYRRSVA
jgi:hypothetical protein